MRISHLKISNILGIDELEFDAGKFNEVSGPNGAGKTSVLEAVKAALGQGHDATLLRKLAALDAGTGPLFYDDEAGGPIRQQSHRWLLAGRAEIHAFRQWLYARQGRLVDFWLPSWAADLVLVASAGSGATQIDVEACGYTDRVAQDIGRRDIRIELASGSSITRRITDSEVVSASVERLTLDATLGTAIAPADVVRISFLDRVRLDADAAEIAWWAWDAAESRLMTRGSRNDL